MPPQLRSTPLHARPPAIAPPLPSLAEVSQTLRHYTPTAASQRSLCMPQPRCVCILLRRSVDVCKDETSFYMKVITVKCQAPDKGRHPPPSGSYKVTIKTVIMPYPGQSNCQHPITVTSGTSLGKPTGEQGGVYGSLLLESRYHKNRIVFRVKIFHHRLHFRPQLAILQVIEQPLSR